MQIEDSEFENFLLFMGREREKARNIEGRRLLKAVRTRLPLLDQRLDAVKVMSGGRLAALDQPFRETGTFLPSVQLRTQLRLASHYLHSADEGRPPGLRSFVVLRVAIECIATTHWLMSGDGHRESVERVLKRMWWDTHSAAEMATVVDGSPDQSAMDDLRRRISEITTPIKRLDAASILKSKRERLSRMVEVASRDLRPQEPSVLRATWMLCAGVSHGNIPLSAGAGVTAALIQSPSRHLVDEAVYAHIISVAVDYFEAAIGALVEFASRPQPHQPPVSATASGPSAPH
jgi:hypothetical protein